MNIETVSKAQIAQEALIATDLKYISFTRHERGEFSASCYWPNGDVVKDIGCHGTDATLPGAIEKMMAKVEAAKNAAPILKTAAECKEAVLNLIREHDAAPASFRDAVDALPVKG